MFQSLSRSLHWSSTTHRKAQKLNHDISVDLSASAINYHQMVCRRDIIKSNGTDYLKYFFISLLLVLLALFEGGKQWMEIHFPLRRNVQIISIFNFHCVWMHACMNVKTDIRAHNGIFTGMFILVAVPTAYLSWSSEVGGWIERHGWISAVKFEISFSLFSPTDIFRNNCSTFLTFFYIRTF